MKIEKPKFKQKVIIFEIFESMTGLKTLLVGHLRLVGRVFETTALQNESVIFIV